MKLTSNLLNLNLKGKRVLLRADANIPLRNGKTLNNYRLQALLPTIDLIRRRGGKIIFTTHLGRPRGREQHLSTKALIPWFKKNGYTIAFATDLEDAYRKSIEKTNDIVLIENLRFFPGEKTSDNTFAQQLARCGDYYVNDAFAVSHRNDTSVTLVPQHFSPEHRTVGLLVEKELTELNKLIDHPKKPFILVIGGGKVTDKIPLISALLDSIDTIILCPAIVFSFLYAQGKTVGNSLVDKSAQSLCNQIIKEAQQRDVQLIFPSDYVIAEKTFNGPLRTVNANNIPHNGVGLSIGPKTIESVRPLLLNAHTIFYNGLMGDSTREETLTGAQEIFKIMGKSAGFSVIGGGDSVAAAQQGNVAHSIDFLSTGGGAILTYLSGKEMPGLTIFVHDAMHLKNRTKT